jgi:pimeloyl-ACP methyl ester carboxylesterase
MFPPVTAFVTHQEMNDAPQPTFRGGNDMREQTIQVPAMQHARVNGVTLEYDVAGQGEPVLLISPVVADGFLPLLAEPPLTGRYQLITYHKRGWGGSTHTVRPVSVEEHAADAAALLAHLGVRRAHIVGHSSGAAVAAQLALLQPELVQTLALLELSLLSVPGAAIFLQKAGPALAAYAAGNHETALALFMTLVSGLEWEACRTMLDSRVPGSIPAAVRDADTFFGIELPALGAWTFGAAEAARIPHPVLSMLGAETEPLWVEIATLLGCWLPRVEECTIAGAGHLLQIQRPEAVAKELAGFFGRHGRVAG